MKLYEPRWQRRRKLIENAITVAALKPPVESEYLAHLSSHALAVWNSHADLIDRHFGPDFLRARIVPTSALGCKIIVVPSQDIPPAIDFRAAMRLVTILDAIAGDPLLLAAFPNAQPGVFEWMADLVFMVITPESAIVDHASRRGGIWDRKLRKRASVQATKRLLILHQDQLERQQIAEHQRKMRYGLPEIIRVGSWARIASRTKFDDPATE